MSSYTRTPTQGIHALNLIMRDLIGYKIQLRHGEHIEAIATEPEMIIAYIQRNTVTTRGKREVTLRSHRTILILKSGTGPWQLVKSTDYVQDSVSAVYPEGHDPQAARESDFWAKMGGLLVDGYRSPFSTVGA